MKQQFLTKWMLAALLVCAAPVALLAQDEKGKDEKVKIKEKQWLC